MNDRGEKQQSNLSNVAARRKSFSFLHRVEERCTNDGEIDKRRKSFPLASFVPRIRIRVACSIFDLVFLVRNFPRLGLLKHCLSPFSFGTSLFKKACGISGGSKRRGKEIVQSFVCGFNREFPKAGASENETVFAFPVGLRK